MNIEQRKTLEKIVRSEIAKKYSDLREKEKRETEKVLNSLTEKNRLKAMKLKEKREMLYKEAEKLKEELSKLGFYVDYDERLIPKLPKKKDEEISEKFGIEKKKLNDVETKLVAKVWGVETDFNSLMKEIEKELAKF